MCQLSHFTLEERNSICFILKLSDECRVIYISDVLINNQRQNFKTLCVPSNNWRKKVYVEKTMKELARNHKNYDKYKTIHVIITVDCKELNSH